jgi:hypothetical protein
MRTPSVALRWLGSILARVARRWALVLTALLLCFLQADGPPPGLVSTQVEWMASGIKFDFIAWEVEALLAKLFQGLLAPQRYMDEEDRSAFVRQHAELVAQIQRVTWEIEQAYVDPLVEDPGAATSGLRQDLALLREERASEQALAEAILEEQVASVLGREGFSTLGQELPPVSSRLTPLPLMLIVSPRERIEVAGQTGLVPELDTAERESLEEEVDSGLNVSSLVTGIGGLAAYPAMIAEHSSLNWLSEVMSHEWCHHYLTLRPLGWNYLASGDARTINETVATIVGGEIGREVIAAYYPALVPPEPEQEEDAGDAVEPEPPAVDCGAEMRETRVRVDELLAESKVEEAEQYMEERRQEFVAICWPVRKLNQAYFAFHGSYAASEGAAGADPVGPAVRRLREISPDLHSFVADISRVTTLAELQVLLEETEA